MHDGKRIINEKSFEFLIKELNVTEETLRNNGLLKVHPEFRIIAVGEPPAFNSVSNWLSPEVLSLFLFHEARTLSKEEEMHIITSKVLRFKYCFRPKLE